MSDRVRLESLTYEGAPGGCSGYSDRRGDDRRTRSGIMRIRTLVQAATGCQRAIPCMISIEVVAESRVCRGETQTAAEKRKRSNLIESETQPVEKARPMESPDFTITTCLEHQRPEDQMSRVGLVCMECKRRLYLDPPAGRCMSFWESQPGAYSRDRRPCFVFTLRWDDYHIRSLHPADSETDQRGAIVRDAAESQSEWDWMR